MATRRCLDCPALGAWKRGRCPTCQRRRDRGRGRRYDSTHTRDAAAWRAAVRAGELVLCWRCGLPITDADDLHLGHDDADPSVTRGPEHARACNLRAAGLSAHGLPYRPPSPGG